MQFFIQFFIYILPIFAFGKIEVKHSQRVVIGSSLDNLRSEAFFDLDGNINVLNSMRECIQKSETFKDLEICNEKKSRSLAIKLNEEMSRRRLSWLKDKQSGFDRLPMQQRVKILKELRIRNPNEQ